MFPCGAFISCVAIKCLSKCPYFKKHPLPWNISGCAPELKIFFQNNQIIWALIEIAKVASLNLIILYLENSKEHVVLGVTIDIELIFDSHIKNTCRKAGQILGVLLRITSCLNSGQKNLHLVEW